MPDPIIAELWEIKDTIAAEHPGGIDALIASLRSRPKRPGQPIVDLSAQRVATAPQGAGTRHPDQATVKDNM